MRRLFVLGLLLLLGLPPTAWAQSESAIQTGGLATASQDLAAQLAEETAALNQARQELEKMSAERELLLAEHDSELKLAGEIGSLVRDAASELLSLAEASPVMESQGSDADRLGQIAVGGGGARETDIQSVFNYALNYMRTSSSVVVRKGVFVDRQGLERQGTILQLGFLPPVYRLDGAVGYLTPEPDSGRLLAAAVPPRQVQRDLTAYLDGGADSLYLDISGGAAVKQLALETTWWESLARGGMLVWPILFIGLTALVLILERLFFLVRIRRNTDGLITTVMDLVLGHDYQGAEAAAREFAGLPIGNVLRAGLAQRGQPREIMESGLSEAILREMPRLERFIPTLKVLAAVAPLLGLLGTVTGLIKTFHVITLYGSSDPRLMAGGIGEALITTQLGLSVAIPIMIVGALLNRQVQGQIGEMEEKALSLMSALLKSEG